MLSEQETHLNVNFSASKKAEIISAERQVNDFLRRKRFKKHCYFTTTKITHE